MRLMLLCLGLMLIIRLPAQQLINLHFTDPALQASATNPALYPDAPLAIALPGLSYHYGNSSFSFEELVKSEEKGVSFLDVDGVFPKLKRKNFAQVQLSLHLFQVQKKIGQWYFSLSAAEKLNFQLVYSKDLVDLLWNGNAHLGGQTVELSPEFNGRYYRDLAAGAAREFGKFRAGARLRFLSGIADLTAHDGYVSVYTDPDLYSVRIKADYEIRSSSLEAFLSNPLEASFNMKNPGAAIDLGLTYQWKENVRLSASLLDVGFIHWSYRIRNYTGDQNYHWQGINFNTYFTNDTFQVDEALDSVRAIFLPNQNNKPYTSWLAPVSYFSGVWTPDSRNRVGALIRTTFLDHINYSFALYGERKFGKQVRLGMSWALVNKTFLNFGMNGIFRVGMVEVVGAADNLYGVFAPRKSKNANFRIGVNLYPGHHK